MSAVFPGPVEDEYGAGHAGGRHTLTRTRLYRFRALSFSSCTVARYRRGEEMRKPIRKSHANGEHPCPRPNLAH